MVHQQSTIGGPPTQVITHKLLVVECFDFVGIAAFARILVNTLDLGCRCYSTFNGVRNDLLRIPSIREPNEIGKSRACGRHKEGWGDASWVWIPGFDCGCV